MAQPVYDLIIIGGGLVGLSTAKHILRKQPRLKLLLLEKEPAPARHQSGRNSGVIHSGLYYKPGSKKALLCVKGRDKLVDFARKNNIAHDICGKIVVATNTQEIPRLEKIFQNGIQNGLEDIRMIDAGEIANLEPHCRGIQGIHIPTTGITDYREIARKLAEIIAGYKNAVLRYNQNVDNIRSKNGTSVITASGNKYQTKCSSIVQDCTVTKLQFSTASGAISK